MGDTVGKLAYKALRRGWKHLSPQAQKALRGFVVSQRTKGGYRNAGGSEDPYYLQFGKALETLFSPWKLLFFNPRFEVPESQGKDTVYGQFMDFLANEKHYKSMPSVHVPERLTTNAACCILTMQHQTRHELSAQLLSWLQQRQDETGGFRASEQAPVPDMLSTAVALFTLKLTGTACIDASDFIQAHWMDEGGFTPTVLDSYSDVEYVFYGLLALGSL